MKDVKLVSYLGVVVVVAIIVMVFGVVTAAVYPWRYTGYVWKQYYVNLNDLMYHAVFVDNGKPYIVGVNTTDTYKLVLIYDNLTVNTLMSCAAPVTVVAANRSAYAICGSYLYRITPYGYESVKSYMLIPSFAIFNHFTNNLVVIFRVTDRTVIDVVGKNEYTIYDINVYGAGFAGGYYYLLYLNLTDNYWYIGKFNDRFELIRSVRLNYSPYVSISGSPGTFAVNEQAIIVIGEIMQTMHGYYTYIYLHNLDLTRYNVELFMNYVHSVVTTKNYHLILLNTTTDNRGKVSVVYIADVGEFGVRPADMVTELFLGSSNKPYIMRLGLIDSYGYLNNYITGLAKESSYWYLTFFGVVTLSTVTTTVTNTVVNTVTNTATTAIESTVTTTTTIALPVYVTKTVTVTTEIAPSVDYFTIGLIVVALVILVLALVYIFRRI